MNLTRFFRALRTWVCLSALVLITVHPSTVHAGDPMDELLERVRQDPKAFLAECAARCSEGAGPYWVDVDINKLQIDMEKFKKMGTKERNDFVRDKLQAEAKRQGLPRYEGQTPHEWHVEITHPDKIRVYRISREFHDALKISPASLKKQLHGPGGAGGTSYAVKRIALKGGGYALAIWAFAGGVAEARADDRGYFLQVVNGAWNLLPIPMPYSLNDGWRAEDKVLTENDARKYQMAQEIARDMGAKASPKIEAMLDVIADEMKQRIRVGSAAQRQLMRPILASTLKAHGFEETDADILIAYLSAPVPPHHRK